MPYDEKHLSRTRLSVELARRNPEGYKRELVEAVGFHTVKGEFVIGFLKRKRHFDLGKVSLNLDTWVSRVDSESQITLGVGPMPQEMKETSIFLDAQFDDEKLVVYRFLHELSHILAYLVANMQTKETEAYNKLGESFMRLREYDSLGITPWGGLDFYRQKGADTQALEDMVELTNMYVWNPDYLKQYLQFLVDPRHINLRRKLGVSTLVQNSVDNISSIIHRAIEIAINQR